MDATEYKELLNLKAKVQRLEETDGKHRMIATLRTRLLILILELEQKIENLTALKGAVEEIAEDL